MKIHRFLLSLAASVFFLSAAPAEAAFPGLQAALRARDALVREFTDGGSHATALAALDRIVEANLDVLARAGEPALAARLRAAWEREFGRALRGFDVGDHAPLSRVLGEIVTALREVLGKNSKYEDLLADVETMNFVLPIAFAPRGEWRTRDRAADRAEYADHFVPFAGIVTYYASLAACRQIANANGLGSLGKRLCPRIADRLEREMDDRLAPKLADAIFDRANGLRVLRRLSERDYLYRTERDLEAAIR